MLKAHIKDMVLCHLDGAHLNVNNMLGTLAKEESRQTSKRKQKISKLYAFQMK